MDIEREIKEVLKYPYFKGKTPPIKATYFPSQESKFLIITGENASGKSFAARLISARAKNIHKIESIRISMELRTSSGMMRAFVFGDESWESTGMISLKCITGGINTCNKRENDHCIIFDEPDVGLSEYYQAGMGLVLADFAKKMPKRTKVCTIVTHSRALVKQLAPFNPHFLRIGDEKDINQFLEEPKPCSIQDIEDLEKKSMERFKAITKILNSKR